jgi:hypothetical protein
LEAALKIRRRTEITQETREVLVLRGHGKTSGWCDECGAPVKMVRPDEAAAAIGISLRLVFQQLEAGKLHFEETDEGSLFICLNSLLK